LSAADHRRVPVASVAEWRRWLRENHDRAKGVWLIVRAVRG